MLLFFLLYHIKFFSTDSQNEDSETEDNISTNESTNLDQPLNFSKNVNGWLWVGALHGNSENPQQAMKEALEKLKCRYANLKQVNTIEQPCVLHCYIAHLF